MTTAVLSFVTPGVVGLRCAELGIDEQRPLEAAPPFAAWSRVYAAHHQDADVLLGLGVLIGRWIDGGERWLERLVAGAVAPLVLEIETRARADRLGVLALDAPWELTARVDPAGQASTSARWRVAVSADGSAPPVVRREVVAPAPPPTGELAGALAAVDLAAAYHLALDPGVTFGPVRRIGRATAPRPPSPYRLSVVFMAAQPDDVAGLDVDGEEAALREATGDIGLDLVVDDSGTVDGLAETMARTEACDVAHVTCHGLAEPRPVLLLESEDGRRLDASADDLAGALAGQPPSLTFLSACSTASASSAGRSLASDLCRRGWPALLGWSAPVADGGAIRYAASLYRQLARRQRLVEVVALLRRDAHAAAALDPGASGTWHLPRLYLGPAGGDRLVDGTGPRVIRARGDDALLALDPMLAPTRSPVAGQRRRAVQRIQIALRRGERVGALIHGGNARDRGELALRLIRRWPDLRQVVVTRQFDPAAVLVALSQQLVDDEVDVIVARHRDAVVREPDRLAVAVREILEGPAQRAGHGAFALLVHGLEQVMVATPAPHPDPAHLSVLVELVQAFRGAATESRLVMTSADAFSAIDASGDDVTTALHAESLGPAA